MMDVAPSATPLVERLAQPDAGVSPDAERDVLRALETGDEPFRYQLAVLLEEKKLWTWVVRLAPRVLAHASSPSEEALWRALDAWASFVLCNYDHSADEALKVANMTLGTGPLDRGAKTRALTMLAYTRDVSGDHGTASAWYQQALQTSLPHQRPGLLLDLATSLSKQGRYEESLATFGNSLAVLEDAGEPRATRLRAQNLSRRAVVFEMMGNPEQAAVLQHEAIALARSIGDRDGAFSASLRLVRHLVALRRFDDALAALDSVADLAVTERNGHLYVAHDRARVLRARHAWADARGAYAVVLAALPPDAELVRGNLDIWLEITAGLGDVFAQLHEESLGALAAQAHAAARGLAAARGIYLGEPVERARLAEQATGAAERLRTALRERDTNRVSTAHFLIDFNARTITRRANSTQLPLSDSDVVILRRLSALPREARAQRKELDQALRDEKLAKASADDFKYVILEMRKRLRLRTQDLIVGRAGPGGGYRLDW